MPQLYHPEAEAFLRNKKDSASGISAQSRTRVPLATRTVVPQMPRICKVEVHSTMYCPRYHQSLEVGILCGNLPNHSWYLPVNKFTNTIFCMRPYKRAHRLGVVVEDSEDFLHAPRRLTAWAALVIIVSIRPYHNQSRPFNRKAALRQNAAALIVVHNHPSGDPTPSPEDVAVTRQLVEAGKLLDVEVLDHLVIGQARWVSLRERRLGFTG